MTTETEIQSQPSTAQRIRSQVLDTTDCLFYVEDFEGSSDAVSAELRRLVRRGELEHIRRGVYWRGRKTRFGMSLPRESEVLRHLTGDREAIGAAGWYATNLLGLSTQVSPVAVVALTTRAPTGFRSLRVIDRSSRTGRRDHGLNELEVTILEALEGWDRYVEAPGKKALARFIELFKRSDVRVKRLAAASPTESAVVRERLREVLLQGGWVKEAAQIRRARGEATRRRALAVVNGRRRSGKAVAA